MNEVPLTFDCSSIKTMHFKGVKIVSIIATGNEKTSFMCVLACAVIVQKLKPLFVFICKTHPKDNFINDVVVTISEKRCVKQ